MVLDALAAGKDVYVEKPLCQTPEQGVELVQAEANSKNIVQVGMQRRSYDLYLEGRKIVASGALGNIRMVRSWWLNNYLGGTKATKLDGPLDWEQWQGPVKKRVPLDPDRFRNWRNYLRLCRRHHRRPRRARLRRHPSADECELSGRRHCRRRTSLIERVRHAGDRRLRPPSIRKISSRRFRELCRDALQEPQRSTESARR